MTTAHNIDDYTEPYHAFHNHPSDKSFSFPDIRRMVLRKNMLSLTAQGNGGSKYVMLRRLINPLTAMMFTMPMGTQL